MGRWLGAVLLCSLSAVRVVSVQAGVQFDAGILKERGLNPGVAAYFADSPRFPPGSSHVMLRVNGTPRGTILALFNPAGQLCADADFIAQAGLVVPEPAQPKAASNCPALQQLLPQSVITLYPERDEVDLVVPQGAVKAQTSSAGEYVSGGSGLMINYDALGTENHFDGRKNGYQQAAVDVGMNANDWLLRSRHIYSRTSEGLSHWSSLETYASHTLVDKKETLSVGQINTAGNLFSGVAINGLQLTPESSLQTGNDGGVVVSGIAQSQARVEVRQGGALIYSTLVPPGPFSLSDIPLISATLDLNTTVIEADGTRQQLVTPAASFAQGGLSTATGLFFSAGQVRNQDDEGLLEKPWVVMTGQGWSLSGARTFQAGAMAAKQYYAVSGGWDEASLPGTILSSTLRLAEDGNDGLRGVEAGLSGSTRLSSAVALNASYVQRSAGYRDFADTLLPAVVEDQSRYQRQLSAGTTLNGMPGSLTLSWVQTSLPQGRVSSQVVASWSKTLSSRLTLSLNYQHTLSASRGYYGYYAGDLLYANVSMPFGTGTVSTFANERQHDTSYGVRTSQTVNDQLGYNLSVGGSSPSSGTDLGGNVQWLPRYTQMTLGYSQNGSVNTSYSAEMRGGLVLYTWGMTASPYPIQDTFGIISAGKVAGVKVITPSGPVWTDFTGHAVLSSLSPWRPSNVRVAADSLPRNTDIINGVQDVSPGYAAVPMLDFKVVTTRRVLLRVTLPDGRPLPKGASVNDTLGDYVTTVVDDGIVFLTDARPEMTLTADLPDQHRCTLHVRLPSRPEVNVFFEKGKAQCTP